MTKLLIVESPAKAKKIQSFLGKDYIVLSSYGHITGLKKDITAIEADNNFKMNFDILKDKHKIVKNLKASKAKCDEVIIATDEDREGEAIAWHLMKTLSLNLDTTKRIVFNEITKSAIERAIENPETIRMNLVNAQFGRMALDHIVGFRLSPLLWNNVNGAASAGRVQSLIVKLIIDKEIEIKNYKQRDFYRITGSFYKNNKDDIIIKADIEIEVINYLQLLKNSLNAQFYIKNIKTDTKERKPQPPFTTSTLQQEGCKNLGITSSTVMNIAQKLYDNGLITYHRTDSVNLSSEFIKECKDFINDKYGTEYSKMKQYKTNTSNSQEAHEAIRPTNVNTKSLLNNGLENNVYQLIWKRAVASQMSNEKYNVITLEIANNNYPEIFISKIEDCLFKGYRILYTKNVKNPLIDFYKSLDKNDKMNYKEIKAEQKIKKLPDRYSESSLVKELEKKGIGRPSTYASIIEKVQNRKYILKTNIKGIQKEITNYSIKENNEDIITEKIKVTLNESKNKMTSTELGRRVNNYLSENFTDVILNYDFTANLEKNLDSVLKGDINYIDLLKNFYKDFIIIYNKLIMEKKSNKDFDKGRLVGNHPDTNEPIYVRVGKFGPLAQIGEGSKDKKPKYINLKGENLDSITLEQIMERNKYPKQLGNYNGNPIKLIKGKYGFCILYNDSFFSLYENEKNDLESIDNTKAIEVIQRKTKKKALKVLMNGRAELLEGPYGMYIRYVEKNGTERNIKIPKGIDPNSVDDELLKNIIKKE